MKKRLRAPKALVGKKGGVVVSAPSRKLPSLRFGLATLTVLVFSVIGAAATNNIYHGHVVVTQDRTKGPITGQSDLNSKATKAAVPAQSAVSNKPASEMIAKYGPAAKSTLVAAAIEKLEFIAPIAGAKLAADRSEALQHGYMKPGTSQAEIIMAGYVPPGMSQEQAAFLYAHLPHTPMMPQPMTPESIARMAGEPGDPMDAVLQGQGLSRNQIAAQNDREFRSYVREQNGPIYIPPLHRDHQGSIREMTDGSGNIVAQYAYDPFGQATKLQGSLDSDFQYAGYYYHAPSGLNLTLHRAYSPTLGRWLSRDPIEDLTFRKMPRSPEPHDPGAMLMASASGPILSQPRRSRGTRETNPYLYVKNNPISWRDPTGLAIGLPQPVAPLPFPIHFPIHPPPPGEPGAAVDLYDCYDKCAKINMTYQDYLDCCSWCDEHYSPDPECKAH